MGAFGESGDTRWERIRYITGAKRLSFKPEGKNVGGCETYRPAAVVSGATVFTEG